MTNKDYDLEEEVMNVEDIERMAKKLGLTVRPFTERSQTTHDYSRWEIWKTTSN